VGDLAKLYLAFAAGVLLLALAAGHRRPPAQGALDGARRQAEEAARQRYAKVRRWLSEFPK
jgi:hypothetical protein